MRSENDARFHPMPGDSRRENGWDTFQVVTRATDWAVEYEYPDARDPAATREVVSLVKWSTERGALGVTWTPKVRTAEDAQYDPLPGDTVQVGGSVVQVVSRFADTLTVRVGESRDLWAVAVWSVMGTDASAYAVPA